MNFLNFRIRINFENFFQVKEKIMNKYFFLEICFKIKWKFLNQQIINTKSFYGLLNNFFSLGIFFLRSWTIDVLNHLMNFYTSKPEPPDPPWFALNEPKKCTKVRHLHYMNLYIFENCSILQEFALSKIFMFFLKPHYSEEFSLSEFLWNL